MRNERPNLCALFVLTIYRTTPNAITWRQFFFTCCPSRNYIERAIAGTAYEELIIPRANIPLGHELHCGNGFTILLSRIEECLYLASGSASNYVRET